MVLELCATAEAEVIWGFYGIAEAMP